MNRSLKIILSFCLILFCTYICKAERIECKGIINKIEFDLRLNLSFESLSRGLDVSLGMECDEERIRSSIETLKKRRIFSNVSYALLRDQKGHLVLKFIPEPLKVLSEIEFFGNSGLKSKELKRAILIRPGDSIDSQSAELARQKLMTFYQEQGYFDVVIKVDERLEDSMPLVSFLFWIEEGRVKRVQGVEFEGEGLENIKSEVDDIKSLTIDSVLSKHYKRELRQSAYEVLRDSGYSQARVRIMSDGDLVKYNIRPKSKLEFKIEGNSSISDSKLLASLRLDSRLVPLRANVATSLCEDIINQYRETGFIEATIDCEQNDLNDISQILISIKEGPRYKVLKPKLVGNKQVSKSTLASKLSYDVGLFASPLAPTTDTLELDVSNIRYTYAEEGFESVDIKGAIEVNSTKKTIREKFEIEERGEVRISSVQCEVDSSDSGMFDENETFNDICQDKTENLIGQRYKREELVNLNEFFKTSLIEHGYPTSKTTVAYDSSTSTLDVELNRGKKIHVRRIICAGNYFTQDYLILREIQIKEGDLWDATKIESSKQSLFGLGVFSSVQIGPLDGELDSEEEDLYVQLKEKETGIIQGLMEVSTQDGLHLQGQLAQRNLFGTGRAIVLGVDGYFKQGFADFDAARTRLAYASPKIFDSSLDYSIEGFFQTALNLNRSFKLNRQGLTQSLRYPLLKSIKLNLSQTLYTEEAYDVDPDLILGPRDVGSTLYSGLRASVELDKRDDPFVATRGYRLELGGGILPEEFGSETGIAEAHFDGSTVVPLSVNNSYAIHLRGGLLEALNEDIVPLGSRYFLGGRDTIRGYTRYQVGPRSVDGLVVGGDTMVAFSQEIRHSLNNGITVLGFLDIAQAMLRNSEGFDGDTKYRLEGLRYSPGMGVQYGTPIGPLSVELGLATNREFGERWGRFIVSIGNAF